MQVDRAMAVNPSIDLQACVTGLDRLVNRMYDQHFVRLLNRKLKELRQNVSEVPIPDKYGRPRRLFEFDDCYTAPVAGFGDARNYYLRCSATQFIPRIQTQTLILTASDDPLVPVQSFEQLTLPEQVQVKRTTIEQLSH